jgi:hypothetical protein
MSAAKERMHAGPQAQCTSHAAAHAAELHALASAASPAAAAAAAEGVRLAEECVEDVARIALRCPASQRS